MTFQAAILGPCTAGSTRAMEAPECAACSAGSDVWLLARSHRDPRVKVLRRVGLCHSWGRPGVFLRWADPRLNALLILGRTRRDSEVRRDSGELFLPLVSQELQDADARSCSHTLRLWIEGVRGRGIHSFCASPSQGGGEYEVSEFIDGAQPGEVVNGVRNENLEKLSWPSGRFDLVVTTEVFEHVHDPWRAFAEVRRVLRPGGRHFFTVPDHDTLQRLTRCRYHRAAPGRSSSRGRACRNGLRHGSACVALQPRLQDSRACIPCIRTRHEGLRVCRDLNS